MIHKKICHLTSVHSRYDTRIFLKECKSLTKAGYVVSLIVADGKGNEVKDNIHIYDVGKSSGRLKRMIKTTKIIYKKSVELNVDIYHIHDPELIPAGLKLKRKGLKVIFDSHEDLPKQVLNKPYLTKTLRLLLSKLIIQFEKNTCKIFDAIVAATPYISEKFLIINNNTIDINNFPILDELIKEKSNIENKKNNVCYLGGITKIRGIEELIIAISISKSKIKLILCGEFDNFEFKKNIQLLSGWSNVEYLGFINRDKISEVLSRSIAGIVVLYPVSNYIDSLPIKMFEYMSAGIPVICSNFPLWKIIVEGNKCGICVDPLNPKEISSAIDYIANNPKTAQQMGENGRLAVEKFYNWESEEKKLFELYSKLL